MKSKVFLTMILLLVLVLGACASGGGNGSDSKNEENAGHSGNDTSENSNDEEQATEAVDTVEVELINSENKNIGKAELKEEPEGVVIKLEAENLPPGTHGFHIHETGKCEAPTFESAGGHFNPTGASHGFDHEEGPHAGDLPNLEVPEDGKVEEEVTAENVTLKPEEENSLLGPEGTALVIHAEADDGKSQPAGDAGDRIACGVISQQD